MKKTLVAVITGSDSDLPSMQDAFTILEKAGVPFEVIVASAHRSLKYVQATIKNLEKRGIEVIIAGAGAAAALPGVIAAETIIPVIGVPMDSSSLKGMDALYSMVQMPGGIPVATMAIGKAGAKNAAIFAVEILSLNDPKLKKWMKSYKVKLCSDVLSKSKALKQKGYKKYIEEMKK